MAELDKNPILVGNSINSSTQNKSVYWIWNTSNRTSTEKTYIDADTNEDQSASQQMIGFLVDDRINLFDNELPQRINYRIKEHEIPKEAKRHYEMLFIGSLSSSDLYSGQFSETEKIIDEMTSQFGAKSIASWLNDLFLGYAKNPLVIEWIIYLVSQMDYIDTLPHGPTMAMVLLCNPNARLSEGAIRAFIQWNEKASLDYLTEYKPKFSWLEDNWNRAITYIQQNGV